MDFVYVAELQTTDGRGWTSVHTSQEAAEVRLLVKAEQWRFAGGYMDEAGFVNLDDVEGIQSYGVSFLPVEA